MNFFSILFGWFLGVLSTLGYDRIKKYYEKEEFKKGVFTELKQLRSLLVASVYVLSPRYGTYNRDLLKWVYEICAENIGIIFTDESIKSLEEMLKWSDKKIAAHSKRKFVEELGKGKGIKKYYLPFLDSNINLLSSFDMELQRQIHEVRERLSILHQEIDFARYFFEKTFDSSLTPENAKRIADNLDLSSKWVMQISRQLADKITYIIKNFSDRRWPMGVKIREKPKGGKGGAP